MSKVIYLFFLVLMILGPVSFGDEAPAKKKKALLNKGKIFHHSKPKAECQNDKECSEEAHLKCASGNAKFQDCNEQYKGTWITTCECL